MDRYAPLTAAKNRSEYLDVERRTNGFYLTATCLMLLIVLVGFQDFYLRGGRAYPGAREIPPAIRTLVVVHGFLMVGWVLLALAQTLLVTSGKRRLHQAMGPAAIALAIGMVITGSLLNVESTRIADRESLLFGMTRKQFMATGFSSVLLFAGLLGVGLMSRRKPKIHRPMMFLATLSLLDAAIGRMDSVTLLYKGTVLETTFGPSFGILVLGAILWGWKWWVSKLPDLWYLLGYSAILLVNVFSIQFAKTTVWNLMADSLLR